MIPEELTELLSTYPLNNFPNLTREISKIVERIDVPQSQSNSNWQNNIPTHHELMDNRYLMRYYSIPIGAIYFIFGFLTEIEKDRRVSIITNSSTYDLSYDYLINIEFKKPGVYQNLQFLKLKDLL